MLARSRQATALLRALQAAAPPSSCGGQGLQAGSELLPALQHLLELTRQCSHVPGGAPAAAAAELPPPATLAALATRSTSTSTSGGGTRASSWSHGLHTSAVGRDSSSSSSSIGNGGELGDGVAEVDDSPAVGSNGVAEIRLVAQRDSSVKQTVELLQREAKLTEEEALRGVWRLRHQYPPQGHCALRPGPRMFSFEQEVEPVARLLLSIPGLNVQYCFTRHPHILVCGVPTLLMRRVGEALTARLGLHGGDLGRIVGKYPWVLSQPLKQRTLPLLDYLDSLGATQDQQRRLFKKTPMMMGYPIAAWQRRLQYLQVEAGLSEEAAVLAVLRHPQIVCVGTPACDRWLRWLVDLGMPLANVPHTLTRLPALLTYGGEKRDSFLRFMRDELQLPDAAICRVLFHAPDTMSRNVERLRHNVAAMRDCGLSDAQIRRLVAANPSTLRYDLAWPTYADKLAFLREHLLREDETLPDKVVTYPFYLSYRLDRIAGRTAYLKELGMPISSLQAWLAINERRFCEEWCKTDVASFHSFLQHWRGTSEGQRWLGLAERRKALMSDERIAFEAAADARTDAAVAADASARADKAAARASRLRASIGVLEANAEDAAVHGKEAEAEEARKQAALLARQARYWQREADRLQPEASGGGDGAGAGGEAGAARQEEVAAV